MFEYVTGDDIAAEARMTRDNFPGTILLVEGDDDILFFERFTKPDECHMIPGRGRENVLNAVNLLDSEQFEGLLAIIDADFWNITDYPDELSVNVCVVDNHDIEVMIFESGALFHLLKEYGSNEKIEDFIKSLGNGDIRQAFYGIAFHIGVIRLISAKKGLGLDFQKIKYENIINKDTLKVNIDRLIRILLEGAECHLEDAELLADYDKKSLQLKEIDRSQLCCGDDLIAVIYIALRKSLGSVNKKIACRKFIVKALRLAYDSKDLKSTGLYKCVVGWEANNQPYKVFNI